MCIFLNGAQCDRYGHTSILREKARVATARSGLSAAWEKIVLMIDYLDEGYAYVLGLDLDAVFSTSNVDIASMLAKELDASGKDLILTDCQGIRMTGLECLSAGCINTGVMMVKNTRWSREFLRVLLAAVRPDSHCGQFASRWPFENACVAKLCHMEPAAFGNHVLIMSGDRYNRASGSIASLAQECTLAPFYIQDGFNYSKCVDLGTKGVKDPDMYVLHLIPGKLGAYTLLFDLYGELFWRYGEAGVKWFQQSGTRATRDPEREPNKVHLLASSPLLEKYVPPELILDGLPPRS
eukprot:TRINITY_DN48065_c0_g1_i1.p1 TRINITY_DN48065_c0_g1~~TRINITY_DN48065_c0_g1_i1.p1  ORF type:complete len:295 (-),score=23.58 TRINITY_DN48065_c0_g1_i1:100-984(-)